MLFLFVAVGLLFCALAIPLMQRRVPPNGLYGLRVRATFADETVWYEANARSGRDFFVFGLAQIVLALALPFVVPEITDEAYDTANTAFLLLGALWVAAIGIQRADRLLREREERSASNEAGNAA